MTVWLFVGKQYYRLKPCLDKKLSPNALEK